MDILIVLLFGLVIGSFLNVVILRTKRGTSPMRGRSACEKCERKLSAGDLIPILSFLVLRGKCRSCSVPLTLQYPLVEAGTGILFAIAYTNTFPSGVIGASVTASAAINLISLWVFLAVLIVLFVYDLRWFLVPMNIVVPAIVFVYLFNSIYHSSSISCLNAFTPSCVLQISWIQYALAALIGGFFFYAQYIVSRGAWVGEGDIYLGLLIGAMVGYPMVLVALFIAYMIGAAISVLLLTIFRYTMKSAVPFGPFLAIGAMAVLLFENPIQQILQKLFYFL